MIRTALVAALVGLAGAQAVPGPRIVTAAVTRYVIAYEREFVALVADEITDQRVTRGGTTVARRQMRGELFSTFVDDRGGWMSVHDIQVVDGVPVPDRQDVRTLLRSQSLRDLGPRLSAQNARFNLGHVSRNFNEPTLALLLFTPAHVRDLSVDLDRGQRDATLVTLRVRLDKDAPLVGSLGRRVTTRGAFDVEPDTGRVRRTRVTFDDGDVAADLDTQYALDPHVSVWVPVTFVERYTARKTGEVIDVSTTLSNYRRYDVSVRVVP